MSNHFPAMPGGLQLQSLKYTMNISSEFLPLRIMSGSSLSFTGVDAALAGWMSNIEGTSLTFTFATLGDAGSFDQDAAETALAGLLDALCQQMAALAGISLVTVRGAVTVGRTWLWSNAANDAQSQFFDTMAYPPS
jgi:hypothetical protein